MERERVRFWTAIAAGLLVMILFMLITVNVFDLVPLAGPFFGGLAAGYVRGKDYLTGAAAGITAGIFGAFVVSADILLNTGFLSAAAPHTREIATLLFFFVSLIYFPVLAFIGGAFGGMVRKPGNT